jgi:hypothetical protein
MTVLERWRDHGADYRVLYLSDERAIVELLTCLGEPVDRLESDDPSLLEHLRGLRDGRTETVPAAPG